jgi:3-oxoacyl-[acyl-carrier-protein] synthase II
MDKKVVVTGMGVISAIGLDRHEFWRSLLAGKPGISKVSLFDTSGFKRHCAGEIKDFDATSFIPAKQAQFMGRASQFACAAVKMALQDAKLDIGGLKNPACGVFIGTTMSEASVLDISCQRLLKDDLDAITKKLMLSVLSASLPRNVGTHFKIKGNNLLIPCACAAGNYTIVNAFDLIRRGEIDMAIVGGAEALSRVAFQGFQRLYAMAEDTCAPFDQDRQGMLLGEGAGVLVLESGEQAKKRKADIYAEVLGYGLSCDAGHITIPAKEGIAKAMAKALKNSRTIPCDIDYISAHGTGTSANDKAEAQAVNSVFGGRKVPMSSIKSMLGHSLGAASALEAIACCLAIKTGNVPPTINFRTPDPDCDVDCVPNQARALAVRRCLNNAFAFGGNNCCVVFGA